MSKQTIAILNYENSTVEVRELPSHLIGDSVQIEDVEDWLDDQGYSVSNIQFMYGDLTISIDEVIA